MQSSHLPPTPAIGSAPGTGTTLTAQACWLVAPGKAETREEPVPSVSPNTVLVRALHSAISRGTETRVFRGEVPRSEYERMRAPFQAGEFPAPVKYGYSSVGLVEQGPADLVGKPVFCLFPHQSLYRVPVQAVHLLPEGVPPARALLAANMETAVNALWDAAPRIGDRIAVVGGGVLGLLVAYLASRIPGCSVQLVDTQAARQTEAHAMGAQFALPDDASGEADLVIHASGQGAGLATALRLAGMEATVLELSWYGDQAVTLALGEAFHTRRLVLRSSQVGQVAKAQRGRWDHRRRLAMALSLLADARLDILINTSTPFAQLPSVLARLASTGPDASLCCRVDYP